MLNATKQLEEWEKRKYGVKAPDEVPAKSAVLGFDVIRGKPLILDISRPLNALFYGKKGSGKSLFLTNWLDNHYLQGYTTLIAHDLHHEHGQKNKENAKYYEELKEGADAAGVDEKEFRPDYKELNPFSWDENSFAVYSPEFIKKKGTTPISLDFLSLPAENWLDRLGYHSQSRKKRRAFEILYDTVRKLRYENPEFRITQEWIDEFLDAPEKFLTKKQMDTIPYSQIEDVMSTIEMELIRKNIIEGEYVRPLWEIFSPNQNVIIDFSNLELFSQLKSGDKLDPRDLFLTIIISLYYEWVREQRENNDRTAYRISMDEMQEILVGYKATGSTKQPLSLQSIGLFVTQARKYGVGMDVAFQSGITNVPRHVIPQFDLLCISDMPMDKTDLNYFRDVFNRFSNFQEISYRYGFGNGREYHFWVFDTANREIYLIVPYPNMSHKRGSTSYKKLKVSKRSGNAKK